MKNVLLGLSGLALTLVAPTTASAQTVLHYWDFETTTDAVGGLATTAVGTPDMSIHATYGEALPGLGKSLNTVLNGTTAGGGFLSADVHDGASATALDFGTTDFSFSYWTYDGNDGDSKGPRIFDCLATTTTGLQLGTNATPVYNLRIDDHEGGSTISNNTLAIMQAPEVWVHVAVTIDRANSLGEIYFDGVSQGTFPMSGAPTGIIRPTQDLVIGIINTGDNAAAAQDSGLDDLAFYDGLLSATDITGLASGTLTPLDFLPPVTAYCFGDGNGTSCPCASGGAGEGCANSTGAGAAMTGSGLADTGADTFVLGAAGLPATTTCLFFQGTNIMNGGNGNPFGDGLRCIAGNVVRLQTVTSDGSGNSATTISLSVRGGIAPGTTMDYQMWYRDTASTCGSSFNTSNAWRQVWN